jgi:hypothetical protein
MIFFLLSIFLWIYIQKVDIENILFKVNIEIFYLCSILKYFFIINIFLNDTCQLLVKKGVTHLPHAKM